MRRGEDVYLSCPFLRYFAGVLGDCHDKNVVASVVASAGINESWIRCADTMTVAGSRDLVSWVRFFFLPEPYGI